MRSLNRWLALNVIAKAGSQQGLGVGSFRAGRARAQTGMVGFSSSPERDLIDGSGMGSLPQHSFAGDESALIAALALPPAAARKPPVLLENDD